MIRRWSKNISKRQHTIKNHTSLKIFGEFLHRREFWNLNRSSVSRGVAIGLFWAFMPLPFQMVFSTATAFLIRGNVAIAVTMVWITNPLTMPPIYYACYKLGAFVMGREELPFKFEVSWEWIASQFDKIFLPLMTGSLIIGGVAALLSYYLIHYLWFHSTKRDTLEKNRRFRLFEKYHPKE